ncbi:hypothetical protein XFF6166_670177 [Xanthomonas citri pv. fuscans]|uniref:Uncharacterized protein n=2 Tax=Xanthomonas citri TaxID=346 RepID=A0AB33C9Y3_XANCI|nr:hypothetical protein XcvCFBP7111P_06590 [Xanthomonas citri pv. vignicola]PTY30203.1 hypothetical protein XAP3CFBP6996_014355 [Xanthomonas citri pv. fuscans CFBP 6996]QWN04673.1 hypothetical protein DGN16_17590 [Xanthomonas citri pv. fuscans]QWN17423.1 hypothetical protein DGN02_17735 [Xanthomonas citri]ASK97676.1 hypothetical protein XcvCFBP7112P_16875 [Xanthomonas citri pv. vignicola]
MTKAAVLPVVFDQAFRASPTALAASRMVGNGRHAIRPLAQRHRHGDPQPVAAEAKRSPVCTGASAGCFCMTIPIPPP